MMPVEDVAVAYYSGWPTWVVAVVVAVALLSSLAAATAGVQVMVLELPAVRLFSMLLAPFVAVLATWQGVEHVESRRVACTVYALVLLGLLAMAFRFWAERAPVILGVSVVCVALWAWAAGAEVLRRTAASVPTSVTTLILGTLVGVLIFYLWANEQ